MKKTIANTVYFRILFIAIVSTFVSCGLLNQETLEYKSVFKGYSNKGAHSRAIAVNNGMVFTGGAKGVVSFRYLNNQSNNSDFIPGIEDFRDIHYNKMGACLLMNSGDNGLIYGITPNGDKRKLYDTSGVFLDGMDFWGDEIGIVYGDPIDGKFFLAKTLDMGRTWKAFQPETFPDALENEGGFAASGSGIQTIGDATVYFATGLGEKARLFCSYDRGYNWVAKETEMKSGDSFGIYSIFFLSEDEGFVIGGSYVDSTYNEDVCQYTNDGGDTWKNRSKGLLGYCSSIHGTPDGKLLVATGRMGTFYSVDKGKKWQVLTETPYYTCIVSEEVIVLSGKNGTLEFIQYKFQEKN